MRLLILCLPLAAALHAQDGTEFQSTLRRLFAAGEFKAKTFGPARWMDFGNAYTTVEDGAIVRYHTASGRRDVLVSAAALTPPGRTKPLEIADYSWSNDGTRLLLFTNTRKVWRQNTRGDYWILERGSGKLRQLGGGAPEASLMFAKFSPDGRFAAYVRENNIYLENVENNKIRALTGDGSETIINGTSDWVYEEEFNLRDGFRWSPDGKHIAYWRFDTSPVGRFPLVNQTGSLYPVVRWFPYPKVGTANSLISINVVDVASRATKKMDAAGEYIPRIEWCGPTELALQIMNRLQNRNDVLLAGVASGRTRRVFTDEDKAWVDVMDEMRWLHDNTAFIFLSERDGWRRAYVISRDGKHVRPATPPGADVIDLVEVDSEEKWLYYLASPGNATERYLFRARLDGSNKAERLTPRNEPGTHTYAIAPNGEWAFHTRSAFDMPPVTDLVRLPKHVLVRTLEDNHALREAAAALLRQPVEFFRLDIGGGVVLDGWMLKPLDFQPSRKYPLLMHVYGEPASVTAVDQWGGARSLFHRLLANQGYIVASVDNRGTPAPKGREWRKVIYGSVGVLSSREQAAAVRALLAQRPYLDAGRVAVWGWSGGGSNTLNLMFRSPELYKVGMAVAPVPDQTLYDTIYQERYMGLPEENAAGYREGSPIHFAEGLRGNLLIVHGTGDDNVHYPGTERLINRLVELGKPFDMMAYPNRTHSISEGEGTSLHVYSLLARYLMEHLPPTR
ncbi:MAG: S9 family peptidase [Bryobacterales bacterium]|nr:S9 family peptidase [Bryobacterales bacterium]